MKRLKAFLDEKVTFYNNESFIANDPVMIPHLFSNKQDIEIMGLFAAVFAWGRRATIINKCRELVERLDGAPYDFVMSHSETDLRQLVGFRHRTFNDTDLLWFIFFFRKWYADHSSLEEAFIQGFRPGDKTVVNALNGFRELFFSQGKDESIPAHTRKHISAPAQNAACKRLNMYLRWMVRNDGKGVDFGIWNKISPSTLMCPLDLHVGRVARKLSLLSREQTDWKAVEELTDNLRKLDPQDPVKYDFALFGLGIAEDFGRL